jgi:hypothetical protein
VSKFQHIFCFWHSRQVFLQQSSVATRDSYRDALLWWRGQNNSSLALATKRRTKPRHSTLSHCQQPNQFAPLLNSVTYRHQEPLRRNKSKYFTANYWGSNGPSPQYACARSALISVSTNTHPTASQIFTLVWKRLSALVHEMWSVPLPRTCDCNIRHCATVCGTGVTFLNKSISNGRAPHKEFGFVGITKLNVRTYVPVADWQLTTPMGHSSTYCYPIRRA